MKIFKNMSTQILNYHHYFVGNSEHPDSSHLFIFLWRFSFEQSWNSLKKGLSFPSPLFPASSQVDSSTCVCVPDESLSRCPGYWQAAPCWWCTLCLPSLSAAGAFLAVAASLPLWSISTTLYLHPTSSPTDLGAPRTCPALFLTRVFHLTGLPTPFLRACLTLHQICLTVVHSWRLRLTRVLKSIVLWENSSFLCDPILVKFP